MGRENIHDVVNANNLAKKLVDLNFKGDKDYNIPRLLRKKFNEYITRDFYGNQIPVVLSEEYVSRKSLDFVHSNVKVPFNDCYMESRFVGDTTVKSLNDSSKRLIKGEPLVGDCVGLSQIIKYLLDSNGISNEVIFDETHMALELKIDGDENYIETTVPNGYGVLARNDFSEIDLISAVSGAMGAELYKKGSLFFRDERYSEVGEIYIDVVNFLDKALINDRRNNNAYFHRAILMNDFKMFDIALHDMNKAIKLNSSNPNYYYQRGTALDQLGRYEDSLLDFEKYAFFSDKNFEEVKETIEDLKEKIKSNN